MIKKFVILVTRLLANDTIEVIIYLLVKLSHFLILGPVWSWYDYDMVVYNYVPFLVITVELYGISV